MLRKIEYAFVGIGLSLLIFMIFLAALLRFWGIDMSWSVDMAQLTFAWVCFIGADLAMAQNRHMGVDMILDRLPQKKRYVVILFNMVLILAFLIFVVIYGLNLCIVNYQRSFQTLPFSYSYATASAPIGSILMIITVVKKIIGTVKELKLIGNNKGEVAV